MESVVSQKTKSFADPSLETKVTGGEGVNADVFRRALAFQASKGSLQQKPSSSSTAGRGGGGISLRVSSSAPVGNVSMTRMRPRGSQAAKRGPSTGIAGDWALNESRVFRTFSENPREKTRPLKAPPLPSSSSSSTAASPSAASGTRSPASFRARARSTFTYSPAPGRSPRAYQDQAWAASSISPLHRESYLTGRETYIGGQVNEEGLVYHSAVNPHNGPGAYEVPSSFASRSFSVREPMSCRASPHREVPAPRHRVVPRLMLSICDDGGVVSAGPPMQPMPPTTDDEFADDRFFASPIAQRAMTPGGVGDPQAAQEAKRHEQQEQTGQDNNAFRDTDGAPQLPPDEDEDVHTLKQRLREQRQAEIDALVQSKRGGNGKTDADRKREELAARLGVVLEPDARSGAGSPSSAGGGAPTPATAGNGTRTGAGAGSSAGNDTDGDAKAEWVPPAWYDQALGQWLDAQGDDDESGGGGGGGGGGGPAIGGATKASLPSSSPSRGGGATPAGSAGSNATAMIGTPFVREEVLVHSTRMTPAPCVLLRAADDSRGSPQSDTESASTFFTQSSVTDEDEKPETAGDGTAGDGNTGDGHLIAGAIPRSEGDGPPATTTAADDDDADGGGMDLSKKLKRLGAGQSLMTDSGGGSESGFESTTETYASTAGDSPREPRGLSPRRASSSALSTAASASASAAGSASSAVPAPADVEAASRGSQGNYSPASSPRSKGDRRAKLLANEARTRRHRASFAALKAGGAAKGAGGGYVARAQMVRQLQAKLAEKKK